MSGRASAGAVAAVLLAISSCASNGHYVWVTELPMSANSKGPSIRVSDRIYLLVRGQESLTGELPVRADGSIVHPVLGRVEVVGMSAEEAARAIAARLENVIVHPEVTVSIVATGPCKISVVGEVTHPGPLEIDPGENMLHVLARAGGFTEFANRSGIYVIREHPERGRIRFRYGDLEGGDPKSLGFRMHDGDVVVVE